MRERLWAFTRTLLFFVVAPGTIAGLIPWLFLRAREISGVPLLGVPLAAAGAALLLVCGLGFSFVGRGTPSPNDAPRELVVWGPYRWVRNPMYVGVLGIIAGEAIAFSIGLLVYAALVWVLFHVFVVGYEEPNLEARFGSSYLDYTRRVRRWIPRPPR